MVGQPERQTSWHVRSRPTVAAIQEVGSFTTAGLADLLLSHSHVPALDKAAHAGPTPVEYMLSRLRASNDHGSSNRSSGLPLSDVARGEGLGKQPRQPGRQSYDEPILPRSLFVIVLRMCVLYLRCQYRVHHPFWRES